MPAPIQGSKASLREWARGIRSTLDFPALSPKLCARFLSLPEFASAETILLYAALPGEIDVLPLAETPGKRFFLPRCAPNRQLTVHGFPCPLAVSRFGIREPEPGLPEFSPDALDLVVVPGLAFTRAGDRLGYGGGYYDRFLPRLREECVTVGISPEELVVENIPIDSWDFPVGILVAPAEIFRGGV